jgi:multidrug efflux pump subunit AcrA (membrane-fusion protein)
MELPAVLRRLPLPALILGAALLIVLLLAALKPRPQPPEIREKVWPVAVMRAMPGTHQPQLWLHARLVSPSRAIVKSAIAAPVQAVPAREGDTLPAGAVLVELDPREADLALRQREAEQSEARAQLDSELIRQKAERAANSGRVADYEAKRARLQALVSRAQAQLERARLDRERSQVRLPFAARIAAVHVAPGDRVREGDRLLEVYDPTLLEARATLTHAQAARLRQALAAGGVLTGRLHDGARQIAVTLRRLAGETAVNQAGLDAFFGLAEPDAGLTLGRVLELSLDLPPEPDTALLPVQALYGTDRVYALTDGRLRALTVERAGERRGADGDQLLLRAPAFAPQPEIVITHLPNAVEGLKATPVTAPAAAP